MYKQHLAIVNSLVILLLGSSDVFAVSYQEFTSWLENTKSAPVDGFSPNTYGQDSVNDLRNYLPPGYADQFDFPELSLELTETQNYQAHPIYRTASEKFAGTATIGTNGALENYTAGQPFVRDQIIAADDTSAGYMVAWNHIRRWQNMGYRNEAVISYIEPTADGQAGELLDGMHGGGNVTRHLSMFYHRVYLSGLATEEENNYRLKVDDSDTLYFKEYIEMLSPFDVAGLKIVLERPIDQTLGDQVNSYLPTERRVRRLSAKERSDSWLGTNWTLDDFEGYSGLVLDNNWRFIGEKVLLHVASSKHERPQYHGPMSVIPLDRWQQRPCYVVEAIPRWDGHPYGRRVLFIDQETFSVAMTVIFDRNDEMSKVMTTVYKFSDELENPPLELSTPRWLSSIVVNLQDGSANVAAASSETEFVTVKASKVRKLFSVSNLTGGR